MMAGGFDARGEVWDATLPLISYLTGVGEAEILEQPYALFRDLYADRLSDAALGLALKRLQKMIEYTSSDSMQDLVHGAGRRGAYDWYGRKIFGPLSEIVNPVTALEDLRWQRVYAHVSEYVEAGESGLDSLFVRLPVSSDVAWAVNSRQGQAVRCMVASFYVLQYDVWVPGVGLGVGERVVYRRVGELFVDMLRWAEAGYKKFPVGRWNP